MSIQNQIIKLYGIYFNYVSKMYSFIIQRLSEYMYKHDSTQVIDSNTYKTIASKSKLNYKKIVKTVRYCYSYSIQTELFGILDFVWQKNIDIAYDQLAGLKNDFANYEDTGKIEKSYLEIPDPRLRAIHRGINDQITLEDLVWEHGNQRYDEYEY